jgi:ribosomal protein S18 acetylase RimI-like enzyme
VPRPPAGIELDVADALTIVPANDAYAEDLHAIFGPRGYAASCQCQRWKFASWADRKATPVAARMARLEQQTHCGYPSAATTSGLVAYLEGVPVGWCNIEPRTAFVPRLLNSPVPWKGRDEDPADPGVWAVMCFGTRAGYRRRGIARALARAAPGFARERGAQALEAYPMLVAPGENVTWGELFVGSRSMFEAAGFEEVSRPTLRRCVMRIDFRV